MQVHHGFEVKHVAPHAVNDGAGKAVEVQPAIFAPQGAPAFRRGHDAAQRGFELVKEVVAQTRLPLFIP